MKIIRYPALLLAWFLAACGGSDQPDAVTPAEPSAPPPSASDDPNCPVSVPGTSVSVEDAEGGAALVFSTTGDVTEVRRRAREMARMHNEVHAKMGPLPSGGAAGHDHGRHEHGTTGSTGASQPAAHDHAGHGSQSGTMVQTHSHAQAEDLTSGARIVFHADARQLGALRSELEEHARHLASGRCRM